MNFRETKGKQIQWENTAIAIGFSNFRFVEQHYDSHLALRRLFSLARKLEFKSVLIDEISESECSLLEEENKALALRSPDYQKSEVHRISFFKCSAGEAPEQADFLGYVVFKRDYYSSQKQPRAHVFESITVPHRQHGQNNFVHTGRQYKVNTSVGEFAVFGVLYAQQNDSTFVCAHVALRTVLASVLSAGDISYGELNSLAGIDHKSKTVGRGTGGLRAEEIEQILSSLKINFQKVVNEPKRNDILPRDYQRDLYGFIESGFPALVGFELAPKPGSLDGDRHIIPVFGHTFNEDSWLPDAQRAYFGAGLSYYPSENWLSTFVVHDDNFGPYFCLPRHFLKKDNFRIIFGLTGRPVALRAIEAEAIGLKFCDAIQRSMPSSGVEWYDRFSVYSAKGWLVLRTLLMEKEKYLRHLEKMRTWGDKGLEPGLIQKIRARLPQTFWMVEASAPELFASSRRKLGEFLVQDKQSSAVPDLSMLLGVRLPGIVYLQPGALGLEKETTQVDSHTPLFLFTEN